MVKQATKERRQAVRAERILSIEYILLKRAGKKVQASQWHLSTTENMSITGLAFLSEEEFKVGDVLHLKVTMSCILDIFNGEAKVIRIDQKKKAKYPSVAVKLINSTKSRPAKSYQRTTTTKKVNKRV